MQNEIEDNQKKMFNKLLINKAEEFLYNEKQTSSRSQINDLVKEISKIYKI